MLLPIYQPNDVFHGAMCPIVNHGNDVGPMSLRENYGKLSETDQSLTQRKMLLCKSLSVGVFHLLLATSTFVLAKNALALQRHPRQRGLQRRQDWCYRQFTGILSNRPCTRRAI